MLTQGDDRARRFEQGLADPQAFDDFGCLLPQQGVVRVHRRLRVYPVCHEQPR